MWYLCTEMSKEDHLIITKKIEYTLCGHSVIMNKRSVPALSVLKGVMPTHFLGPCREHCFPYRKIRGVHSHL